MARRIGAPLARPGALVSASGGGSSLGALLDYNEASCGRISAGFYLSADGQTATEFAADVARIGTRGILIERAETFYAKTAIEVGTSWTAANGAGVSKTAGSASPGNAPDGSTPASMTYGAATNSRLTQTIGTAIPDSTSITLSAFFLGGASGQFVQPGINAAIDGDTAISNTSWTRLVKVGTSGVAISDVVFFENRASGVTQTMSVWGTALHGGAYPLAPYRLAASVDTTGADSVVFLAAQVPEVLRTGKFAVTVTPEWAPSDLASGDVRWIFTFGTGAADGMRFRHTGTDVRVEVVDGGSVVATSPAVTGSTREVSRVLLFDPTAATVSVDGVAGAVGTAWSMASGVQLRVGGILGGSGSEFDGYVASPVIV